MLRWLSEWWRFLTDVIWWWCIAREQCDICERRVLTRKTTIQYVASNTYNVRWARVCYRCAKDF